MKQAHSAARSVIAALSLALTIACNTGQPAASNQSASNSNGSQPSTPLIVPQNQSKPGLGSIKVGSSPAGAAILLISEDEGGAGPPRPRGSTPSTITDVAPGKYTVHLELQGYKPFQKSIEVKPDQTTTVVGDLRR